MSRVPSRSTAPGRWRPTSCLTATVRNAEPPIAITTTAARPGSRRTTSQISATRVRAPTTTSLPAKVNAWARSVRVGVRIRRTAAAATGSSRLGPSCSWAASASHDTPHVARTATPARTRVVAGIRARTASAGSGRRLERASLHEPNLGRSRWSRTSISGPGQVVVRFWSGSGPVRSGAGQVVRARVGPTPPGDRRRRADRRTSDMSTRSSNAARQAPGGLVDIVSGKLRRRPRRRRLGDRAPAPGAWHPHPHVGRRRPDAGSPRPGRPLGLPPAGPVRAGDVALAAARRRAPRGRRRRHRPGAARRPRAACSRSRPMARTPSSRRIRSRARRSDT